MRKFAILAVMILAAGSLNCSSPAGAASEIVPSGFVAGSSEGTGTFATNAAGGQGKGKGNAGAIGSIPSIDLAMVYDYGTSGFSWGDSVTFTVSTTEHWNQVDVRCAQDGSLVFTGAWTNGSVLNFSSSEWSGGAADCTADLISYTSNKPLASTSFRVEA
jgi:hypothetical protein